MDIVMPKMGESVSEGTILKWHKKKGDAVKLDEIIFEISTDKVDTEIPSPAEGILSEIKFNEGDTVEVGTVVAVIDSNEGNAAAINTGKDDKQQEKVSEVKTETAGQPVEEKHGSANHKESVPSSNEQLLEITMPKMGESVMEGTIIKWHKKVGDAVKKDETFYEISTDKVDTEVPSPSDGFVSEILIGEQETVAVGTVVAKLSLTNASVSHSKAPVVEDKVSEDTKTAVKESKEEPAVVEDFPVKEKNNGHTSKFLSPLVMNIVHEEKLSFDEIDNITGTGLDGRLTKKDLLNYIELKKTQKPAPFRTETARITYAEEPASQAAYEISYSDSDVEKIPMDNIRQKIMQHMINSRDTSVHVSELIEVDMSKIYNYIQNNRDYYLRNENLKLTYLPFIADAAVKALKEFPLVNSSIEGSTIIRKKYVNLGIAVAVEPTGLIVPNIKNADDKSISGLAKSINDLANRARTKKLTPDDITNGTFTITNYGVFGTIFGTPIINQPEVAILGVGTVVKRPVVIEVSGTDTIAVKPIMALTLSHDHRLVDGMLGGKFIKYIKDILENFNGNGI